MDNRLKQQINFMLEAIEKGFRELLTDLVNKAREKGNLK